MGLILDTNVFIQFERNKKTVDFSLWGEYGDVYISAITVSELLVGVHKANTEARKVKRSAFVEAILSRINSLDFTSSIARIHSDLYADLSDKGQLIGAHDLIIAATAISHGYPLMTTNISEFKRVPGLELIPFGDQ
ncbi:MAG: type II toxin-antitoxin system VapC family toxin [gamma proteobacterium symbiont of Taylorina sp.]|nr:type II toxin-antitoxin system VapC family toxin [gamma proteobacterium symbiont of Taylorina sp.]